MTNHAEEQHANIRDDQASAGSREELQKSVGQRLRQKREQMKYQIRDVASNLKLNTEYLEAIEHGDWSGLPGEAYAIGFLRQYSSYLEVDLGEDIQHLKSGEIRLTKPLTFPDPPIAPAKTWAMGTAAAFVLLFILFNVFNQGGEEMVPAAPTASEQQQAASEADVPVVNKEETEPVAVVTPAIPTPETTQAAPAPGITAESLLHTYVFRSGETPVWLQIVDPQKEETLPIKEALAQANERFSIESSSPELILTCGNAASLEISIDGVVVAPMGSLGKQDQVLRNYKLVPPKKKNRG